MSSDYETATEGGTPQVSAAMDEADSDLEDWDDQDGVEYHPVNRLPIELSDHSRIHLEEQYYVASIALLGSLLLLGSTQTSSYTLPARIPPANQISFLATLAVHPQFTSLLVDPESQEVQNLALSYLRSLSAIVGPVQDESGDALRFQERRWRAHTADEGVKDGILGKFANIDSVWSRGQDFFKTLGWAFNTSAKYPWRWKYWKPWLEHMVDVLERDYQERSSLDQQRQLDADGEAKEDERPMIQDSLLLTYVTSTNGQVNPVKPILGALLADGSPAYLSMYPEVFRKEQDPPKARPRKRKRDKLDLENNSFADYDDETSSDSETPIKAKRLRKYAEASAGWSSSNLLETINLRLRLFALLSQLAFDLPAQSKLSIHDVYDKFEELVRHLPLDTFINFIAPGTSPLSVTQLVTLLNFMIPAYLPGVAPAPERVDPTIADRKGVSSVIMEKCYLPFASKASIEANAKMSLIMEVLLRILWKAGELSYSSALQSAARQGVEAREARAQVKRVNRPGEDEVNEEARRILRASGQRLLAVIKLCK